METYLKKISENTSLKPSYQVILSGKGSRLYSRLSPPLATPGDCKYEIALTSLETYYSFPNIDEENNSLEIRIKGVWETITIAPGCYELSSINTEIQRLVVERNGEKNSIVLSPNLNTFKCIMELKDVQVRFAEKSIRTVLGFQPGIYKEKRQESQNIVNILRVNSILVNCSLITSSYINGSCETVAYSFFPNAEPGEKIIERPTVLIYHPISFDFISELTVWLTDQEKRSINLREENLTVSFHIRAC